MANLPVESQPLSILSSKASHLRGDKTLKSRFSQIPQEELLLILSVKETARSRGGVDGAWSAKSRTQEVHGESRSRHGSKAGPGAPYCDHQVFLCPASTQLISRGMPTVSL